MSDPRILLSVLLAVLVVSALPTIANEATIAQIGADGIAMVDQTGTNGCVAIE